MNFLITGSSGFIGFFLSQKILKNKKNNVYGLDNHNKYYDVNLKKNRLKILKKNSNFIFFKIDLVNYEKLNNIFKNNKIDYVINIAAQAGVRYSITNPDKYIKSNILGFHNIIDLSKKYKVKHFVYASSSSVYGSATNFPLSEKTNTDKPLSLYAATKKSNELIAYSYSNLFNLKTTGLRFFTVYGPYGRPDMFLFKLTKSIINSSKIDVYNNGNHYRDFTYIDDVVNSIVKVINKPSKKNIPHQIFNIGSSRPIHLLKFITIIEKILRKKAKINFVKIQSGDVPKTHADIKKLKELINFKPKYKIEIGIKKFIDWYINYYNVKN
jgi:UDP-glucuronate 4-epimerase